jgi:uncharacterized protein (DUF2267 family)
MGNTGLATFDDTIQKTNEILKEIGEKFGWETRRNQTYLALKTVLQTLRDRLTIEESADLAAQLPMLIRGFYYEGWKPSHVPIKMTQPEFSQIIREKFPFDLPPGIGIEDMIRGVIEVLQKHIGKGELKQIRDILPEDFQRTIPA